MAFRKSFAHNVHLKPLQSFHGYFLSLHYEEISLKDMLGIEKVWNGMSKGLIVECKVLRPVVKVTTTTQLSKLWF